MGEWEEKISGEILDLISGYAFKSKNFKEFPREGDLPVIKIKNVANGDVNLDNVVYHEVDEPLDKYILQKGDVLIAMTGNHPQALTQVVGDVSRYKLNEKGLLNQRVGKIVAKKKNSIDYLYYYLKDKETRDYLANQSSGSANQANISKGDILGIPMLAPEPIEQKNIAEVLSSLDDKIDLLHRQNKTLEAMAQTLFREWFVEEAEVDWKVGRIGDFVKTNKNSITKNSQYKNIKYLDTGSLTSGAVDSLQEFSIKDAPSRAKRLVKHNDILISTVRPNQKHYGIVKNPPSDLVVSTGFCVISCEKIDPHFLYVFLTTNEMTEYLHSIAEGSTSTYPSLKPEDIESQEFQAPPQEKMNAFAEFAEDTWDKIDFNQSQIKTLESLRDTLLPKLMRGEVTVSLDA